MGKIQSLLLIVISLLFFGNFSYAEMKDNDEKSSFTVSVKQEDNQIDKNVSYFDLKVIPKQQQDLTLIIGNTGDRTKKIVITPNNAMTNNQGVIEYQGPAKHDKFLRFTDMVSKQKEVILKPGESKSVTFKLSIPEKSFDGVILGSFVTRVKEVEDYDDAEDSLIRNEFQINKGVILRESEKKILPELKLNKIKPNLVNGQPAITANIENLKPVAFGEMTIKANVIDKKTKKVVKQQESKNLEMAPYSNFDYAINYGEQPIEPGDYSLVLDISSGSAKWQLDDSFYISKDEGSKSVTNSKTENPIEQPKWVFGVLILLVIIFITIILMVIIVYWVKNRTKVDHLKNKKRKKKR